MLDKIKSIYKRNILILLLKEVKLNRYTILNLILLTTFLTISETLFLFLISPFTTAITSGELTNKLFSSNTFINTLLDSPERLLFLLLISFLIKSLLQGYRTFYISKVNLTIRRQLRINLLSSFLNNKNQRGSFSGRAFDMYFTASATASKALLHSFDLILNLLFTFSAVIILIYNFSLNLLLILILTGLLYIALIKSIKNYSSKLSKSNQKIFQQISERVSEIIKGFREIQIYNAKSKTISKIAESETLLIKSVSKSTFLNGLPNLLPSFLLICIILLAFFQNNKFEFSESAPEIITLLIIAQRCGGYLAIIGSKISILRIGKQQIIYLLKGLENNEYRGKTLTLKPSSIKAISLKNFNFSYGSNKIFSNLSINFLRGETNLIVGPSGSGKSTLFSVLLKENSLFEGNILINNIDIKKVSNEDLYKTISLVPQDPYIFSGTILENIIISKDNASMDEVIKATKISGAFDFINALPNKFNNYISESGIDLSGGQKQLISISRAVLRDSPIFLLDEPSNNLDKKAIKKLKQLFNIWKRNKKIVLISTHDSSLIDKDYRIYEINNFKLKENSMI